MTRRGLAALGWLLLFGGLGTAFLPLLTLSAAPHKAPITPRLMGMGTEFGLDLYLFLLFFGRLPGARVVGDGVRVVGPWTAVWSLCGLVAMLAAGGLGSYNILILANLALDTTQAGWHADLAGQDAMLAAAVGGEAAAAVWIGWYLGRLGTAQLTDGGSAGIAWRPASRAAYGAALLCAASIVGVVGLLFRLMPPNVKALEDLPMARLMQGDGWEVLPLLALIVVIGPVVEELVFRGVAFAGFARRFGPVWASVITSVLFVAVHAQEKLHYLPGFVDVGLVAVAACWLRVRFGSIRPGIALHVLYNAGLLFAGGLLG